MRQALALAVLLHIWLVLSFGNVSGTARPGDGVWGRINVTLTGPQGTSPDPFDKPPRATSAQPAGPVGQAKRERFGGAVRPLEDARSKKAERPLSPGAAALGAWSEQRVEASEPVVDRSPAPTQPMMMATPAALTPLRSAAVRGLSPAPTEAAGAVDSVPLPTAKVKVMESAATEALPRRSKLDTIARPMEPPAKLLQQSMAPGPLPVLPAIVAEPFVKTETVRTETVSLPAPAPAPAPVPIPAPEPPKQMAAPVELKRQARSEALALTPAVTAAPVAALAASAVLAEPMAAQARRLPQPPVSNAAATPHSSAAVSPTQADAVPIAGDSQAPAPPRPGSPEAGPRLGVDVATPASTPANTPRLNLSLPRPQGGELARRGSSGVLQMMPAPPELKSKLSEDMEKARREDCRKAYGEQLGLLAVVPLALDAARSNNKGCRW